MLWWPHLALITISSAHTEWDFTSDIMTVSCSNKSSADHPSKITKDLFWPEKTPRCNTMTLVKAKFKHWLWGKWRTYAKLVIVSIHLRTRKELYNISTQRRIDISATWLLLSYFRTVFVECKWHCAHHEHEPVWRVSMEKTNRPFLRYSDIRDHQLSSVRYSYIDSL